MQCLQRQRCQTLLDMEVSHHVDAGNWTSSFGCPRIHYIDQASLKLTDMSGSASHLLGFKSCTTTTSFQQNLIKQGSQPVDLLWGCLLWITVGQSWESWMQTATVAFCRFPANTEDWTSCTGGKRYHGATANLFSVLLPFFHTVIDLDPVEHQDRRQFLFAMLQAQNSDEGR